MMRRKNIKLEDPDKIESTEAWHGGGTSRSSEEVSVMEMEPRGCIVQLFRVVTIGKLRFILGRTVKLMQSGTTEE